METKTEIDSLPETALCLQTAIPVSTLSGVWEESFVVRDGHLLLFESLDDANDMRNDVKHNFKMSVEIRRVLLKDMARSFQIARYKPALERQAVLLDFQGAR